MAVKPMGLTISTKLAFGGPQLPIAGMVGKTVFPIQNGLRVIWRSLAANSGST